MSKTRILIIDDDQDFLDDCARDLQLNNFVCELCNNADDAFSKFQEGMYDVIVCDILIPFRGQREGGLVLADEFSSKYPMSSMIFVSQYVTAKWVNQFAGKKSNYAFVEKGDNLLDDLKQEITRVTKSKSAFVCMPFSREFTDVYELGIKPVLKAAGFNPVRADEIQHNTGILSVIYDQIASAHVLIADLSGQNPNVYYETGYAHGMGKEVVLLTQDINDIPFDLRGLNHIHYEGQITILKQKLEKRIKSLFSDK